MVLNSELNGFLLFGNHYMKSARIRSYSGPYFPVFGLNTVFSPNAGKCQPE